MATQVALGRFDRALKDKGLEGAAAFAADFASGASGGGNKLAEEWREPIARTLKAHLDDAREADAAAKAAAAKAKVESAKRLAAVEQSIGEHTYGMADLERDTQAGMFEGHPDAASRLSKSIEEARKARAAKTEAAARGAEAVAAGRDLTADEDGQGAIDAWWDAFPDKGPAGAIEAARRTGILPGPARNAIADGLIYGTPEKRAEQARALVELIKVAPAAAETLPAQLRQEATRITKRLEQGHDPKSATEGTDKALEGVGDAPDGGAGEDELNPQPDSAISAGAGAEGDVDKGPTVLQPDVSPTPLSLEQRVREVFGMDPQADRPSLLLDPNGSLNPADWTAPRWVYELAKAFVLPGHVMKGGSYTPEDVTDMALSVIGTSAGAGSSLAPRGAVGMAGARPGRVAPGGGAGSFVGKAEHDAFLKRVEERTIPAFRDREEAATFASGVQKRFEATGVDDAQVVVRGSAATGRQFNPETGKYDGPAFDVGRISDLDVSVVSPKLLKKAEELAKNWDEERYGKCPFDIRGDGTRTSPLNKDVLRELGLENLLPKTVGGKRRKSSLVIYQDMESLEKRGPYVPLD